MAAPVSSKELFWSEVEKTDAGYSPEGSVYNSNGLKLAESVNEYQLSLFKRCIERNPFLNPFFSNPPEKVLDLGAGVGANALPMAKAGAHVTAVEISRELLETLSERSLEMQCPSKNLRLIRGDMTKMETYGGPFDFVMALDVFSYLPPVSLRATMNKIHNCLKDRGIFIGSIYTNSYPLHLQAFYRQIGIHLYDNNVDFMVDLLNYSGFKVLELASSIIEGSHGGYHFKAIKISTPSVELACKVDAV